MRLIFVRKQFVKNFYRGIALLGLTFVLTSCGGGGKTETAPPQQTQTESSEWDEFIWDNDNWG